MNAAEISYFLISDDYNDYTQEIYENELIAAEYAKEAEYMAQFPKYWSSEPALDLDGNYVIFHYKWDDWYDYSYIFLGPEPWDPEPVSDEASYQKTDALIDRAENMKHSMKLETLPNLLLMRRWDRDCNASITVYRTKRWCRMSVSHALHIG